MVIRHEHAPCSGGSRAQVRSWGGLRVSTAASMPAWTRRTRKRLREPAEKREGLWSSSSGLLWLRLCSYSGCRALRCTQKTVSRIRTATATAHAPTGRAATARRMPTAKSGGVQRGSADTVAVTPIATVGLARITDVATPNRSRVGGTRRTASSRGPRDASPPRMESPSWHGVAGRHRSSASTFTRSSKPILGVRRAGCRGREPRN